MELVIKIAIYFAIVLMTMVIMSFVIELMARFFVRSAAQGIATAAGEMGEDFITLPGQVIKTVFKELFRTLWRLCKMALIIILWIMELPIQLIWSFLHLDKLGIPYPSLLRILS